MRDKCLYIDSLQKYGSNKGQKYTFGDIGFEPVLICGIPGVLDTRGPGIEEIKYSYEFTTNIDFVDSTKNELGVTIPASITTNDILRDTFVHRIAVYSGYDTDSLGLYWHGIDLENHPELGPRIWVRDSAEWSETAPV